MIRERLCRFKSASWLGRVVAPTALVLLLVTVGGCEVIGFGAHVLGGGEKRVIVEAQYTGLEHRQVAVVVVMDDGMQFSLPQLRSILTRLVGRELAAAVPGIKLIDPSRVELFMAQTPYWASWPYEQVMRQLDAERLIWIELDRFQTQDPGNSYMWRGAGEAKVGVAEADGPDPNHLAFAATAEAYYPSGNSSGARLGVTKGNQEMVRNATAQALSGKIAKLFYTHELLQDQ